MLSVSSPRRTLMGGAVALLATLAVAAPSNAATMVESSPSSAGSTSLNYSGATGLNSHPALIERKAGG